MIHQTPGRTAGERESRGQDDGLRRMLVWVLVALVLAVVAATLIAQLAVHWFDVP